MFASKDQASPSVLQMGLAFLVGASLLANQARYGRERLTDKVRSCRNAGRSPTKKPIGVADGLWGHAG
ncbi:hypothetical protein UB43_28380 [Pseudomonas sp. 21]|nr:hypothetical protein UB43_28380 [Pseudomonas sp. 21]